MKKCFYKQFFGNRTSIIDASQRPKCIFDPQEKTSLAVCRIFLKYVKKPMNKIQKKKKKKMNNISSIIQVKEKTNYQSFQISNANNQENY